MNYELSNQASKQTSSKTSNSAKSFQRMNSISTTQQTPQHSSDSIMIKWAKVLNNSCFNNKYIKELVVVAVDLCGKIWKNHWSRLKVVNLCAWAVKKLKGTKVAVTADCVDTMKRPIKLLVLGWKSNFPK